jgi:hypothetical protein
VVVFGVVVFEAEDSEEAPQVFEWVVPGLAGRHLGGLEPVEYHLEHQGDLTDIHLIDLIGDTTDTATIHGIGTGGIIPGGPGGGIGHGTILPCMLEEE